MMIIASTLAVSIFASILIFLYRLWRKDFDLPLEENTFGSFWKILMNATTYAMSILVQQGKKAIVISNMYLRKTLWISITANLLNGGVLLSRFSLRLMLGLWLLMTIIFINLYTSTLTSYLTVTKLKPVPASLEELAASFDQQTCLLTMQKGHPLVADKFKTVVTRSAPRIDLMGADFSFSDIGLG